MKIFISISVSIISTCSGVQSLRARLGSSPRKHESVLSEVSLSLSVLQPPPSPPPQPSQPSEPPPPPPPPPSPPPPPPEIFLCFLNPSPPLQSASLLSSLGVENITQSSRIGLDHDGILCSSHSQRHLLPIVMLMLVVVVVISTK